MQKHRSHKIKFACGNDANEMLMKKLAYNFVSYGHLTTTFHKAKALKRYMDRMLYRSLHSKNKNVILNRYVINPAMKRHLLDNILPNVPQKTGGYTRITRLHKRFNDDAQMVRIEWVEGIPNQQETDTKITSPSEVNKKDEVKESTDENTNSKVV